MEPALRRLNQPASLFLDALRGTAAQAVVIGHALSFAGADESGLWARPYMQNLAVVVFFAISGFVIAYSTLHKKARGGHSFSAFVIDRASRLFTAFVPALLFVVVVDLAWRAWSPNPYPYSRALNVSTFIGNLFMLQDFPIHILFANIGISIPQVTSLGSGRPFWTIAIEWWLYLGFGWFLLRSHRASLFDLLIGTALLIVPVFNFFTGRGHGLAIVWLAGAAAASAFLSQRDEGVQVRVLLMLALYAAGGAFAYVYRIAASAYSLPFGMGLVVATFCIVAALQRLGHPAPAPARVVFTFIASYSYSLYLIHYTVIEVALPFVRPLGGVALRTTILFCLANVVAWIFYLCTERHYLLVRRWLKTVSRARDGVSL